MFSKEDFAQLYEIQSRRFFEKIGMSNLEQFYELRPMTFSREAVIVGFYFRQKDQ